MSLLSQFRKMSFIFSLILIATFVFCNEYGEQTVEQYSDIEFIHHSNGPTIGHLLNSGVKILQVDGIVVHFGFQDQALLDLISGVHEPSAILPLQMPADMATVENQAEDTPHDMETYIDSEGNNYDFGFGHNWDGVISDERVNTYTDKKKGGRTNNVD